MSTSHILQQVQPILDGNLVAHSGEYPTTAGGKTVLVFLVILGGVGEQGGDMGMECGISATLFLRFLLNVLLGNARLITKQ